MTGLEALDSISLGSCPTCGGPAQFVAPARIGQPPNKPEDGTYHGGVDAYVREVRMPNIDEDLGDGWRLSGLDWSAHEALTGVRPWTARAWNPHRPSIEGFEKASGETPSAAYLALRTAIEARP